MDVAFDIEAGQIDARPENAALLIEAYQAVMAHS
jgi:2-dehydropantoate 2-reductase